MKLKGLGKFSSKTEVTQVSTHGIWLLVKGIEYFLSYEEFPWFQNATISQIQQVKLLHGFHLRWPDLDIDLHLESLTHPEKYPLKWLRNCTREFRSLAKNILALSSAGIRLLLSGT